jgi:hypothetical protein
VTDFILLLLIGACWIWGIHCLFSDGYILGNLGNFLRKHLPEWALKPLIDCPPCMSSIHGFTFGVSAYDGDILMIIGYMVCLCGVNFYIKEKLYPDYE